MVKRWIWLVWVSSSLVKMHASVHAFKNAFARRVVINKPLNWGEWCKQQRTAVTVTVETNLGKAEWTCSRVHAEIHNYSTRDAIHFHFTWFVK